VDKKQEEGSKKKTSRQIPMKAGKNKKIKKN
jgi:hypothetical protein